MFLFCVFRFAAAHESARGEYIHQASVRLKKGPGQTALCGTQSNDKVLLVFILPLKVVCCAQTHITIVG